MIFVGSKKYSLKHHDIRIIIWNNICIKESVQKNHVSQTLAVDVIILLEPFFAKFANTNGGDAIILSASCKFIEGNESFP